MKHNQKLMPSWDGKLKGDQNYLEVFGQTDGDFHTTRKKDEGTFLLIQFKWCK